MHWIDWNMHGRPSFTQWLDSFGTVLEFGEYLPATVNNNGKSTKTSQVMQHSKDAAIWCLVILLPLLVTPKYSASWKSSQASLEQVNHVQDFNFPM